MGNKGLLWIYDARDKGWEFGGGETLADGFVDAVGSEVLWCLNSCSTYVCLITSVQRAMLYGFWDKIGDL